jgi:uncharacterized protein YjbJ (UPF0337 family)
MAPFQTTRARARDRKEPMMDRERVRGAGEKIKGDIKETTGKVTRNKRLENEGRKERFEGEVREGFGKAKDALKDVREDVNEAFNEDDERRRR